MEAAFSWIGAIIEWFGLFIPSRIIVKPTDVLIKSTFLGVAKEKKPGLRWYWPITTDVDLITVARQPIDIKQINFVTKDGLPCKADCACTYYINDPIKFFTENYEGHLALFELISFVFSKKLRSMTFNQIQNSSKINENLTEEITKEADFLGIEVEYVRLQNFTWVVPIGLITDERD